MAERNAHVTNAVTKRERERGAIAVLHTILVALE